MRDLLLTLMIVAAVPAIVWRPYIGILVWSWLGYMNPQRMVYGFAYYFPFSQIIAIVTMGSLLFSREKKRIPITPVTVVWIVFLLWMLLTTVTALNPAEAQAYAERVYKVQLVAFLTLVLITTQQRIEQLVWVIIGSLAFYGVKGGLFALATGGQYRVWGPEKTFIEGNNELALALITVLPLLRYAQLRLQNAWLVRGAWVAMGLCALSVVASHSRGALLAGAAMTFMLWLRGPSKGKMGVIIAIGVVAMLAFLPEEWFQRMETIKTYDQDRSAMGRINAWWFAFHLAVDRPFLGGGFDTFTLELFGKYAPDPTFLQGPHSIYFQVLGEHGFMGLGLFLLLGLLTYRAANEVRRAAKQLDSLAWAGQLAGMLQVALVGFAIGGAFLGLAYWDLPYHIVALTVMLQAIARRETARAKASAGVPAKAAQAAATPAYAGTAAAAGGVPGASATAAGARPPGAPRRR